MVYCSGDVASQTYLSYQTSDKSKDAARMYQLINNFFTHYKTYTARAKAKRDSANTDATADADVRAMQSQLNDINDLIKKYSAPGYKGLYFENRQLIFDNGKDIKIGANAMALDEVKYDAVKEVVYISCFGKKDCVDNMKTSQKLGRFEFSHMPETQSQELADLLKPFLDKVKKKLNPKLYEQQKLQKTLDTEDEDVYELLGY